MDRKAYSTDLTDPQWALIDPFLRAWKAKRPSPSGHAGRYDLREIVNALFYQNRTGCQWMLLPHDLPPWRIVYYYFMVWRRDGVWPKMHDTLRDLVRLRSGKKKPRALRSSILRALKYLTTEECAATMRARRSWDESDISWWTRWV